jgi:hypothetical protein
MCKPSSRPRAVLALLLALATVSGCSESSTEPQRTIEADAFALAATPGMTSFAFGPGGLPRELPCPAGGKLSLEGTTSAQVSDTELSSTWNITTRHLDCAVRINDRTLATSGSATSTGRMRMRLPAQMGERPVMLEFEARSQGEMTTRDGVHVRTCTFDLTQRYDAARLEVTLTGTSCGHNINIVRPQP